MSELARKAGVDRSTVSRALNDSHVVKKKTKEKILRIAEDMGYAINVSARNLRRQSSQSIGIVIPPAGQSEQTFSQPFFLEMVGAVANAVSSRGYDLIVSVPQSETEIAERRLLLTGRADGLIVIGQAGRTERLKELDQSKNRIVVWGGSDGELDYTLVGSDNVKGGRLATNHLITLQRERILFLGNTDLPEVALRYQGYKEAHQKHKLPLDPDLKKNMDFGGQSVFSTVKRLHDQGMHFDAVFGASDVLAITAISALNSLGLNVPQDISVVGYDNVFQAASSTPPLTTINQNIAQGAEMMVELLLKKIQGLDVQSAYTATDLVVRESCGAVLKSKT